MPAEISTNYATEDWTSPDSAGAFRLRCSSLKSCPWVEDAIYLEAFMKVAIRWGRPPSS